MSIHAPLTPKAETSADDAAPAPNPPPEAAEANNAETSDAASPPATGVAGLARRLVSALPTMLVFAVIGGIGYWGHHHNWKIPKFSELTNANQAEGVAWCDEHGVPEEECISCNAELMPKGQLFGWCKEHGVHECVLEHPEAAQLSEVPKIEPADLERAARAIAMRPRTKNDPRCKMHLRRIQFPSIAAADKAGIDIGLVERGPVLESVSATGEVLYDPTLVARLASRAAGTVWRVEKNVGDSVQQGDVLALVDAAQVGQAKAALLQALAQLELRVKNYARLKNIKQGVVPGRSVLEAETALVEGEVAIQKAVQALVNLGLPISVAEVRRTPVVELEHKIRFLGLPDSIRQDLDPERTTSNLLPLFAPRDGTVVNRDVVAGEVISTTQMLFTVADTSRMWLVLSVPLEEARRVVIGRKVVFQPDGADHADTGTLTWLSTDVDKQTRTVKVRGELPNEDGHLRDKTFGAGEIILRQEQDAIVVPSSAVHWEGCCHVVFVRDKNFMKKGAYKVFHTRSVRPGVVMGDTTEMIAGLLPDEVVVTKGSGVLRAELLKGNLGAG